MKAKLAITLLIGCILAVPVTVYASSTTFTTSNTETPYILVRSVNYENGKNGININFSSDIAVSQSASIMLLDHTGLHYNTDIQTISPKEITLNTPNLQAGREYSIILTGIRNASDNYYGALTINFTIPKMPNY